MDSGANGLISIIIPIYNEALTVGRLISNLKKLDGNCEIIFVDGGSKDNTVEIVKGHYPIYISPEKGRASQMNYGASLAKGDILFFLHADSILEKNAIKDIDTVIGKGYKAGCFRIRFESGSLLMKICAFLSNTRAIFRNIAFGDQGIFIKKDYFIKLGGFKPIPIMEDYRLSMDIKKDGQKIALAKGKIFTSERRFVKNGRLKTMLMMQKLQHMYRQGTDTEIIAQLYKRS